MDQPQNTLPALTDEEIENISITDLLDSPELAARFCAYLAAKDPSHPQQLEAFRKKVEGLEPPTFT